MGKYKIDEALLTDKNVITSGKKGKPSQLYSLYIFRVLTEDADYSNPLKCTEIIDSIAERFNVVIDLATIQRYINVFKKSLNDYILEGDAYDGYYLRPTDDAPLIIPAEVKLDMLEANLLVQVVRTADYINDIDKENIILFLSYLGDKNTQDYARQSDMVVPIYNSILRRGTGSHSVKAFVLSNIPEIIREQKVVRITADERISWFRSERRRGIEVCLYAAVPVSESVFYVIGRKFDDDEIICLRTEDIKSIEILEKTFEKINIRISRKYAAIDDKLIEFLEKEKYVTMLTKQEQIKYKQYKDWLLSLGREGRREHLVKHGHEPYVYMKYPK